MSSSRGRVRPPALMKCLRLVRVMFAAIARAPTSYGPLYNSYLGGAQHLCFSVA